MQPVVLIIARILYHILDDKYVKYSHLYSLINTIKKTAIKLKLRNFITVIINYPYLIMFFAGH